MPSLKFNHESVRDAGDHVMPEPFRLDRDTGERPEGTQWIGHIVHGAQVQDASGERFRIMGYGPVQGSVTLRDRHGRLFYFDTDAIVREVSR